MVDKSEILKISNYDARRKDKDKDKITVLGMVCKCEIQRTIGRMHLS